MAITQRTTETDDAGDSGNAVEHGVFGDRFVVLDELGRGAMGRVFRARDLRLGRQVAIKVLAEGRTGPIQRERFEREARAAGALDHPNIMAVHDVGEHDGSPYLVAELLEGETLRDLLSRGALAPKEAHALATQLAAGLAAAHAHGIVHRDLKPENIFVTAGGVLKILDFGIAKLSEPDPSASVTVAGAVLGTPAYMSPEQVSGLATTSRSDVFAFGAVVYEMLSGAAPFRRATVIATGHAILHDAPPALPKSIPRQLTAIVDRCLQKDPAARFGDGNELLAELRKPTSLGARTPWTRRVAPAAAGLVATLIAVGLLARQRPRATRAPPAIAVLPLENLSPDAGQDYFSDGLSEELLNMLATVPGLRVAARTSSFSFKGKTADVREIAARLGVGAVLEGSVRKAGDRIRISARLVNASDGYQLWSESYDRKITDVFAVQDEIAASVVSALKLRLLSGPVARSRTTSNVEAYNEYLLGRQFFRRNNADGFRYATQSFRKAVTLDPRYAPGWAAFATAMHFAAESEPSLSALTADQDVALAAAQTAVDVGADLPDGYVARGWLRLLWRGDRAGARADLERALALSPDDADVLSIYGIVQLSASTPSDAVATFRRATELDPLNAGTWNSLGVALMADGHREQARKAFGRSLEISPEQSFTAFNLGTSFLLDGEPALAATAFARCTNEAFRLAGAAMAEHDLGQLEQSRATLDRMIERYAHTGAYQIAQAFAWWRDKDQAFAWLERARLQRDAGVAYTRADPLLGALHDDPRYSAMLAKLDRPPPGTDAAPK